MRIAAEQSRVFMRNSMLIKMSLKWIQRDSSYQLEKFVRSKRLKNTSEDEGTSFNIFRSCLYRFGFLLRYTHGCRNSRAEKGFSRNETWKQIWFCKFVKIIREVHPICVNYSFEIWVRKLKTLRWSTSKSLDMNSDKKCAEHWTTT